MTSDRLIIEQGPQAGRTLTLGEGATVLGRGDTAQIILNHPDVSRQHARLTPEAGSYRLEDLDSRNGTYVNDERLREPRRLANGDRVRLGTEVVLRLELAQPAEATVAVPAASVAAPEVERTFRAPAVTPNPARLTLTTAAGETTEHTLAGERLTLGRLAENDIVVAAPIVSRRHLTLTREGDSYRLRVEPNVVNPVFVNGQPVAEDTLLRDGDTLSLGPVGGDLSVAGRYQASGSAAAGRAATQPPAAADPNATMVRRGAAPAPGLADAMQTLIGQPPAAEPAIPPQLVVTGYRKAPVVHTLTTSRLKIGRHPENDIVLEDRFVSRYHAEIEKRGPDYFIVPAPAAGNPLVLNGAPVMEATRLQHGAKLRITGFEPGEMVTLVYLSPAEEMAQANQRVVAFSESKVMSVGRDASNDIVLSAPNVSRVHAQIERIGQRYRVRDLGSSNGTYVNGQAIRGDTWVSPGDAIHIGSFRLGVGEQQLTQTDESAGGMRVEARGLNKRVRKDLNILQDISLVFQPSEFVVVVGQSGGGKSTLVDAISGYRPATHGRVLVNDTIDVYKDFDAIRNSIGYVPQKDIIHMELTVFQALDYAAQLRMPADTTREERHKRIAEVLEELDLSHRRDTQISQISGGQQKRVSIGVELLTKPGLFFLDEPTSGLDPGTETELMGLMRRLADQGRTVILITHATKNVMLADRVVFLARGGYLAWFGPPEEALTYFDQYRSERERRTKPIEFDDIYNLLDRDELGKAKDWADRFQQHEAYQKYVVQPLGDSAPAKAAAPPAKSRLRQQPVSGLRQFFILSARNITILTRDRPTLGLMLLAAPLMASLDFTLAFGVGRNPFAFATGDFNDILITLIVLTNNAILVGALSMARELVKERDIYKRERMVNLRLSSYIFSKLWFALLLGFYMAVCFTVIRYLAFQMPGGLAEFLFYFITIFLMIMAGLMIGLFTSAVAPNANAAPLIMVLFILPQIVLSGALVPLPKAGSAPASSHWAFQAAMAISGAGSDVAGDACWTDLTADERKALTRDYKDENCTCLGANTVREASCNFPGVGEYYDAAIDAPDPVRPTDPGDAPPAPEFPDPPETPENLADPQALQDYFDALEAYNDEVDVLRADYEEEVDAYQALVNAYKDDIETYQDEMTDLETDRATAIGSAEALIDRFHVNYGWTFVDKSNRNEYLGTLLQTWLAQLIIITVLFVGTIIAQRRQDVR